MKASKTLNLLRTKLKDYVNNSGKETEAQVTVGIGRTPVLPIQI
jgi:hypothetical protein